MTYSNDLKELKQLLKKCSTEIFDKEQTYEWMKLSYIKGARSNIPKGL